MVAFTHSINNFVARSPVGTWFQLEGSKAKLTRKNSRFLTDVRAGVTTWASMAYIIAVNAAILSDSGGTCVCDSTPDDPICLTNAAYTACKAVVRRDLITTTAAAACLATTLMGIFANLPVGLAPGLGLNAYLAYSQVGFNGTGVITYGEAMAAVFLEGWIFMILSLLGVRVWLARMMPRSLVLATGAGIGLFIAFIGLSPSGLFVVGGDTATLVGLGGCKDAYRDPDFANRCLSHVLQSGKTWVGVFLGGIVTVFLMMYRVKGAILIGILLVAIVSWPRGSEVTYFPHTPAGDDSFNFFKKVVSFHRLEKIGNVLDYSGYGRGKVWVALITFLYVDLFDTTGTLYAMAKYAKLINPVTLDFEHSTLAYCVDGFSISMGALMGTSPVTTYVESSTGISEGGKTGIAAIVTGLCFFISIFFAPIFASIPGWATGGALVIVGALMISNVTEINWKYIGDAIPAFICLVIIPLTYNIAYGVIASIISYALLNGSALLLKTLSSKLTPPGYDTDKEPWVYPSGGLTPPWMKRLARGDKTFWVAKDDEEPFRYESDADADAVEEVEGRRLPVSEKEKEAGAATHTHTLDREEDIEKGSEGSVGR